MSIISMQLSILTLNVWGIPFISSDRKLRIENIAEELASGKYDIVSLQEVWSEQDSQLIQNKTQYVLPYAHYFYSGVMGAGLLVLSKFPIVGSLFHAWPVNGYFHRIQHADWFGGKGVGLCRIRLDSTTYIHVYNAHLHAEYNSNSDEYKTHRVLQAFDTAQFIEATRSDSILQILAGDLNAKPDDLSYKILLHNSDMYDTCTLQCVETYENKENSYTSKKAKKRGGQRIDHIFLNTPAISLSSCTVSKSNIKITLEEYLLPLPNKIPNQSISYSDHEAVSVKIQLEKWQLDQQRCTHTINDENQGKQEDIQSDDGAKSSVNTLYGLETPEENRQRQIVLLNEAISLCDQHLKQLNIDRIIYYSTGLIILTTLLLMAQYSAPYNYRILYLLLKLFMFTMLTFCIFMGFIWNFMERHGTLSGRTSMAIKLNSFLGSDNNHLKNGS